MAVRSGVWVVWVDFSAGSRSSLFLLFRAAANTSRRRDSFDMNSLATPTTGANDSCTIWATSTQVVARFTVPVIHIDKERPLPTTNFPTPLNRVIDVRIIQKHDNIAHGVTSMKPLCLRLRVGIVTRALHAQPDCWVRRTSRPFTHHLIKHFSCRRGQCRTEVWAQSWMTASAGRVGGADSDVDSGTSAFLSSWFSANQTLFNACLVRFSPTRLAAARRRAFPFSVFLSSPSTRIRHSSVWPCARPPLINALQPGQRSDVACAMKSLCSKYSLPRDWFMIWVRRESVNRMPLQTLRSRIDFSRSSSRACEFSWR